MGPSQNWVLNDSDGQQLNNDTVKNAWHLRHASLSSYAGKTISYIILLNEVGSADGHWDMWFSDISIVNTDGLVTSLYARQEQLSLTPVIIINQNGVAGLTAVVEFAATPADATLGAYTTTYYHGDHLGLSAHHQWNVRYNLAHLVRHLSSFWAGMGSAERCQPLQIYWQRTKHENMKRVLERNPVWVGIGLAFLGAAIWLPIFLHIPSVGVLYERSQRWVHFGAYTVIVFVLLAKWFRPPKAESKFWGLLLGLLMLHVAGALVLMRKGAPLTSVNYIIFGPLEMLILGLSLQWGMRALDIREED